MNDRFKFRFWNKGNKKIETYSNDDLGFLLSNPKAQLRYVVMQCTGLKDKNGKLIYEGDIVEVSCGKFIIQYCDKCKSFQCFSKVSWIKELYCYACEGDYHWFDLLDDLEDCEVVGNIYVNKELLDTSETVDLGFWDKDGNYIEDIQEIDLSKE